MRLTVSLVVATVIFAHTSFTPMTLAFDDSAARADIDQVSEQLVARVFLQRMKGTSEFAVQRFASYDEPLELKYARGVEISSGGTVSSMETFAKAELLRLQIALLFVAPDSEATSRIVKAFAESVSAKDEGEKRRKTLDTAELKYNSEMTPERAANVVALAAKIKAVIAEDKELMELRTKLKDGMRESLAKHPDFLKAFTSAPAPSDELRDSRLRVKELLGKSR